MEGGGRIFGLLYSTVHTCSLDAILRRYFCEWVPTATDMIRGKRAAKRVIGRAHKDYITELLVSVICGAGLGKRL